MTDQLDRQIKALGKLGRTRRGMSLIKEHGAAILSLMCPDPWLKFTPMPGSIIRMHLRPEDLLP
jgi:hypothetical protein